jgi:hypothetical protein
MVASSPVSPDPSMPSSPASLQQPTSRNSTQSDIENTPTIALNYEPLIIRCRGGECLWQANNDPIVVQMCKSQLKV